LSEGEFLNSQPEKTLCQVSFCSVVARSCTKSWTKAPVSAGSSQGAVRSHVDRRTMALPICRASPERSTMSCVILLRLLRKPSVATRSLTGVP
jgi:hypothetical protein